MMDMWFLFAPVSSATKTSENEPDWIDYWGGRKYQILACDENTARSHLFIFSLVFFSISLLMTAHMGLHFSFFSFVTLMLSTAGECFVSYSNGLRGREEQRRWKNELVQECSSCSLIGPVDRSTASSSWIWLSWMSIASDFKWVRLRALSWKCREFLDNHLMPHPS